MSESQLGQSVRRPLVFLSIFDWWYHAHGHIDIRLAHHLARQTKVLFVNSIGMRVPLPGRSDRPARKVARKVRSVTLGARPAGPANPNVHVFTPLSFPAGGRVGRLNAAAVRFQLDRVLRRLEFRDPIWVVSVPTGWASLASQPPARVVYLRTDRHSAYPEADAAHIRVVEDDLLRAARLVVYISPSLMEQERKLVGDRGMLLDLGVEMQLFARNTTEDPSLRAVPHPRVGFVGELRARIVDFDLLDRIATGLPDVSLVLAGRASSPLGGLASRPNVHHLPHRPHEQIPAVLAGLDVGLLPYLRNPWVDAINPVKLNEYLAAGLSVVATDFPAVEHRAGVTVAGDPGAFVDAVRTAIQSRTEDSRSMQRELVHGLDWSSRAELLAQQFERLSWW